MMYRTIVVGTDGSETAGVALRHAIELAKAGGGVLHIVHAYHPVTVAHMASASSVGAPTFDINAVNSGIESQAALVCSRAQEEADAAEVKCETHAVGVDAADALVEVAERVGADLIVIGNRGMTGVKRFVLGSVPNKVSHHAPCSLLIVDTARG
jgi:nucleotide-binding universal stress UspA family protein